MGRETRLADRLRAWGLDVREVDGWRTRGSDSFAPRGVVLHHTAGASSGDMPSLNVLIHGRSDLPGPLAHVGLARSGACYVVAAGRCNHAGPGGWRGLTGNTSVFGVEAENDGRQPWTRAQLDVFPVVAAALVSLTPQRDPELVCAHREWSPGRKPDPHTILMPALREHVRRLLEPPTPPPPPPPGGDMEFVRSSSSPTGAVFAVFPALLVHVTGEHYAQLGHPPVRDLPPTDPVFSRPKVLFYGGE